TWSDSSMTYSAVPSLIALLHAAMASAGSSPSYSFFLGRSVSTRCRYALAAPDHLLHPGGAQVARLVVGRADRVGVHHQGVGELTLGLADLHLRLPQWRL